MDTFINNWPYRSVFFSSTFFFSINVSVFNYLPKFQKLASRGAWQDHAHFLFTKFLQENGLIFFHDSFCIKQALVQNIFENFVQHVGPPKRAWQVHTHFLFRKLLQENGSIFFHDSLRIEYAAVQNIFENFVKHARPP